MAGVEHATRSNEALLKLPKVFLAFFFVCLLILVVFYYHSFFYTYLISILPLVA